MKMDENEITPFYTFDHLEPEAFFRNIHLLFDMGVLFVFEGTSMLDGVAAMLSSFQIANPVQVKKGTIWPRSKIFHCKFCTALQDQLVKVMQNHATPEVLDHFHVCTENLVLLSWYDVLDGSILLSENIPIERISAFSEKIGKSFSNVQ